MWTRNCSNYVRTQGLRMGATSSCYRLKSIGKYVEFKFADAESPMYAPDTCLRSMKFYSTVVTVQIPPTLSLSVRYLSSHDAAEGSGEEDSELDEGFSELDDTEASESNENSHLQDDESELISESYLTDEDDVGWSAGSELKLATEHRFCGGQSSRKKGTSLDLSGVLLNEPKSVRFALDKYLSDGKTLETSDISYAMLTLLKNVMLSKALQFSEWLEEKNLLDFNERHYALRLGLIAKVHGLKKANSYLESIPESFRGEFLYRTMLASYVSSDNLKKAEKLFEKMKQSRLAFSAHTCNQMILIYKRNNKKKIADVLLYMEKENIKPTLLTYTLLIDTKGVTGDIAGMDEIAEKMKAEGIEPDLFTKVTMAKHYAAAGLKEKAESVIEGCDLKYTNPLPRVLIPAISLYASLGKADEVERIWKICEQEPQFHGWIAIINAWGLLKQVDKAEAVFDKLAKSRKLSVKHYSVMLNVYANNNMLNKANDLVRRMGESGCRIDHYICDRLVKLYVEAGEVEKADSILQQDDEVKPMFSSYLCVMEKYAQAGDVHNTEKMLLRMRKAGYATRSRPFQALLKAYSNSNSPAYGFRERMRADNVYLNKDMESLLSQADPFKEIAVPEDKL